jgi:hypothetical protein
MSRWSVLVGVDFPTIKNVSISVHQHEVDSLAIISKLQNNEQYPIGLLVAKLDHNRIAIDRIINMYPKKIKGLGTLLLDELIVLALFEGQVETWVQPNVDSEPLLNLSWSNDIILSSTFESMVCFHKRGFKLTDPDARILSNPRFPSYFTPDMLMEIEQGHNFNSNVSEDKYHQELTKWRMSIDAPGLTNQDWFRLNKYYDCTENKKFLIEHHLDFDRFKNGYPTLIDYTDSRPFMKPVRKVLEYEIDRYSIDGKRLGFHHEIPMYLDKKAFMDHYDRRKNGTLKTLTINEHRRSENRRACITN